MNYAGASKESAAICLAAIGHDSEGRWPVFLERAQNPLDNLYGDRVICLSEKTHPKTINAAQKSGWKVFVEDMPIGKARFHVLSEALKMHTSYINLWDGDRLIFAALNARDDMEDIVRRIPGYNFFIAGATDEARITHQKSLTVWEGVKSWALGRYIGINGDICNRGCLGFSREFAEFVIKFEAPLGDDTDGLFPLLALGFNKMVKKGNISPEIKEMIGYHEYAEALKYEDGLFEGLDSLESARRKDTDYDFLKRAEAVLRCIINAQRISDQLGLDVYEGESMESMLRRLVSEF